jgi:RND family efflux transporter MFP subunit
MSIPSATPGAGVWSNDQPVIAPIGGQIRVRQRRRSLSRLLLALGLICGASGCTSATRAPLPRPLAVRAQPVDTAAFPEVINTISTLEAPEEVNLAAQAGGRIESLRIRQGDAVRAGQLLVVLDQTQLREEVKALSSQRDESRLNFQRFEYLVRQGAASPIQRDALRQNYLAADAALKAKQADLAYKDLRAPMGGVVGDVAVKPGDVIRAGTPFTTIQRSNRLLARVDVPARFSQRIRPGQSVLVSAPGGNGRTEGRVVSIDPRVNGATQSFLVKAELDNRDGWFRNGERVRTRLVIESVNQLAVPALAVTRTSGQTFVFVVGSLRELEAQPGNVPLERLRELPAGTRFALKLPVRLGPLQDNRYPVLAGLRSGQSVIVSNLFSLRHGTPVTVP